MLQRLEHLEAIVTSEDWDLLQERTEREEAARRQGIDLEQEEAVDQEVARLAKRVR